MTGTAPQHEATVGLPPGSPRWLREIEMLRTGAAHFLLCGNTGSVHLVPRAFIEPGADGQPVFLGFENVLRDGLLAMGVEYVVRHDIVVGAELLKAVEGAEGIETVLGGAPASIAGPRDLEGLARLVDAIHGADRGIALILADASRLAREIRELDDEEFSCYRQVHIAAEHVTPRAERLHYNPVIWILDAEEDVPSWFSIGNPLVRTLSVPMPDWGERLTAAERKVALTWSNSPDTEITAGADALATHTSNMSLSELDAVIRLAEDQDLGPLELEDAARSYRVGITENPWKRDYIKDRIRSELRFQEERESLNENGSEPPAAGLTARVMGQQAAVTKALDILVRSVSGLTAAHARSSGSKPRGVLFFAGPTGVGKTELAKSLAELLFDDEAAIVRFDMSEFSADHSADRLIGSPPGYVGHRVGGELTNRVRERPFSLVLFDEIEKAHPRILDKFLQILDDGRLTDGRGETVYFSEAVIVFTSNLGIYTDQEIPDKATGRTAVRRVLNVLPEMASEEMRSRVEEAIGDYFRRQLGRPELLNRLGDNIVVFEFITAPVAIEILNVMLDNVVRRVSQELAIELLIGEDVRNELERRCTSAEVLELGGRGIGSRLETLLVNPLARELFLRARELDSTVTVTGLDVTAAGQPAVRLESTGRP